MLIEDEEENTLDLDSSSDTSGIGHNSEAVIIGRVNNTLESLIKLGEEHEEALQVLVDNQEEERESLLLVLGRQLLEGRRLNEGKREFGKWCSLNFQNLREHVSYDEQVAILWAAEFPEQHQDMLDKHSRIRTTRGAHAKWMEEQKKLNKPNSNNNKPSNPDSNPNGDNKPNTANTGSNTNTNNNSTDQDNDSENNVGGINTENPDTTVIKADASMIASSLLGVVTNTIMFKHTQGREVSEKELTSAIFQEIRTKSADELSEDEIEDYIESNLKPTLNIIMGSLPKLRGFESNVINLQKTKENF